MHVEVGLELSTCFSEDPSLHHCKATMVLLKTQQASNQYRQISILQISTASAIVEYSERGRLPKIVWNLAHVPGFNPFKQSGGGVVK